MAPSGLKAVVGESECRPLGAGGAGAHGLWEASGGELGTWLGVEHLTLEGVGGDLALP